MTLRILLLLVLAAGSSAAQSAPESRFEVSPAIDCDAAIPMPSLDLDATPAPVPMPEADLIGEPVPMPNLCDEPAPLAWLRRDRPDRPAAPFVWEAPRTLEQQRLGDLRQHFDEFDAPADRFEPEWETAPFLVRPPVAPPGERP